MEKIIGYKGFDKDLKCRGFQYEIEKEYHMDGKIECCSTGFHLCTDPRDIFRYYSPGNQNRFCLVEGSGTFDKEIDSDDSKIAVSDIKIIKELSLHEIHLAIREYIKEHTTEEASTLDDESSASSSGDESSASSSGYASSASSSGRYSSASSSGNASSASSSGDASSASSSGYESSASSSGRCSGALAVGMRVRATGGEQCVGVAVGYETRARGAVGAWLVLSEAHIDDKQKIILDCVRCAKIDGKNLLADTWYMLKNGHFVQVED